MIILRKGGSAKAFSHYFALFLHREKLVIYTFMGYNLNSIDIVYVWISLNLLILYVIVCCVRSEM